MTPRERFAVNLVKERKKAGITQATLARGCDLHRTEISLLERGGREPRLGTILKLAAVLDVPPGSLCVGMRWDEKRQGFKFQSGG